MELTMLRSLEFCLVLEAMGDDCFKQGGELGLSYFKEIILAAVWKMDPSKAKVPESRVVHGL